MDPLRLDKLQKWIDDGRIDPTHVITMKTLVDSGLMSNIKYGVKIVAHVVNSILKIMNRVINHSIPRFELMSLVHLRMQSK